MSVSPLFTVDFFANASTVSDKYYHKNQSIPYILAFYAGLDFFTIPGDSDRLTIFLKDFEFRGPSNFVKQTYMFALTSDKLEFYSEKIDTFFNKVYSNILTNGAPVLSTFRSLLVQFFLDVHVGYNDHPTYVVDYFTHFIDAIGFISNPNIDDLLLLGRAEEPSVREYFRERVDAIVKEEDKTSFVFWWNE